ncbi:MAG: glycosyltransferase family 2 protein, partial [Actinomycetota bacterium]
GTRDATNSFKAYSTDFVRRVGIESDKGFEIGIELVAKARRYRQPVAEIPTIWLDRAVGVSTFKVTAWLPR